MGNVFLPQLTDEQKKIGLEMRKEGHEYRFIAEFLKLDVGFVRNRLSKYIKEVCPHLIAPSKRHKKSNRVVLTVNDIFNYKHNDNTPRENNNILISVSINGSEKNDLAPITGELNKGLQPPTLAGEILGFDHANNKLRRYCTSDTYKLKRCSRE